MRIADDRWLTELLGHPVYNVVAGCDEVEEVAKVLRSDSGHAMYCTKVPAEEIAAVAGFEDAGFRLVDVSLTLARAARTPSTPSAARTGVEVHVATEREHKDLAAIAHRAFRTSRFHVDPRVARASADRVKSAWVESYARRARGDALFAATIDGEPVGFNAALRSERNGERVATIDLIGVAPEAQGRGVGAALVQDFIDRYGPTTDILEVGTQAANSRSLALYQRFGFALARSHVVLHAHTGGS